MSVNQSSGDKNEPSQNRRSGRSGNPASQRNFQGGGGKGGGGTNAPPSSSFYAGKSFKKVDSNAQGVQTRVTGLNPNVNLGTSNSSTISRAVQNGAHIQPPVRDASRGFPLQFGSISPGVMNVMQVPARTNSSHIHKPSAFPMPSVSGVSMQMPFHQSQLHLPFGGSNPPNQSQVMANTVPLPMHLPVANPPQMPTQVFVPGIPHHPMSSQGIIHQNQVMNFSSQMGPLLGNMGMGLGPQYPQQQIGNYGGTARRNVKITHPDTHEELRLDKRTDGYVNGGSSGPRTLLSFPSAPSVNYYSNSYNANPIFYPPPGSNSLTSAQTTPGLHETGKGKGETVKRKKSLKEILKNADARGTTSYRYKRPEDIFIWLINGTLSSEIPTKQASVDSDKDVISDETGGDRNFEPDDWEDADDISTPKLSY